MRTDIPAAIGGFKKRGTLFKKRGGLMRNVAGQNWQARAFGLTKAGLLVYYEETTLEEAAASFRGLGRPRQELDLTSHGVSWETPAEMYDKYTPHMLVVTHSSRSVDTRHGPAAEAGSPPGILFPGGLPRGSGLLGGV